MFMCLDPIRFVLSMWQELYRDLPQHRRLSKEAREKAATVLDMNANKKMVQQQLCQETESVVDLTNISLSARKGKSRNDLHNM